ncbi:mechanosensitive ion channel domain-containing protein [Arenimonas sp.]|uniref:mechanosensitive ion channel domain-containing protein n=1 Tax=Arenimonas sp. TaxID=1872635 RepID=UPI0039E5C1DD
MNGRCALLVLLLALASTAAAQDDLAARTAALRAELPPSGGAAPESRANLLRRQLLTSFERRLSLEHSRVDAARLSKGLSVGPPPATVLELDDLRRELQDIEFALADDDRRVAVLREERDASAAQLAQAVAAQRVLQESAGATPAAIEVARLETAFFESSTAELDSLAELVAQQQRNSRERRDSLALRLKQAASAGTVKASAHDEAVVEERLQRRTRSLEARLAAATSERARAQAQFEQEARGASPTRREWLVESLANADIELDVTREALINLGIERALWQVAFAYYRDGDAAAVLEAKQRGPALRGRLDRRLDFLQASVNQVLARLGAHDAQSSQQAGADAQAEADRRAVHEVLQQRVEKLQMALLDERRLANTLDRMRGDFDQRIGEAGWSERAAVAWASLRSWVSRGWNFELFTVRQTIEVDGRQTQVPRGVTVGKLVKAPLLLLVGLLLAGHVSAWAEAWLRRRRGADEGSARLFRRWVFFLLVCICALGSLAIAGIPLAAFAFIGGAVAIGIGFGMQTLFKNLISGVLVLIERPFRLGDVIEVGDLRGTVVDIDLRTSVVRDSDGAETLIPNSSLMEENVKNVTFRSRTTRQSLAVTVDSSADPRIVIDAIRDAASRHGQLAPSTEPVVFLDEFADNGLRFVLHYWIELKPGIERRRVASDLRLMILGAFEEAKIAMAPPPVYRA